jgi:SAM-dependent methyltransferase
MKILGSSGWLLRMPAYKQRVISLIRRAGLLGTAERLRLRWTVLRGNRAQFLREHADVSLPPDESSYDAYGHLSWTGYWNGGRDAASFIAALVLSHRSEGRILEWGCGPGRVIRHLPALLPGWEIFGTDRNAQSINWCASNIVGIGFAKNNDVPPLPFPDAHFDCIYNISVFTHLSEEQHYLWAAELVRLLRPGGVLICTVHGDACKDFLLPDEMAQFESGRLVIRDGVDPGSRCFLAYHPQSFVRNRLLRGLQVIEHQPGKTHPLGYQDLWIARKPIPGATT